MREFCFKHQILRWAGEECPQCAVEARAIANQQPRDVISVLKGQVDDLVAENLDLRRRVSRLEHDRDTIGNLYERLAEQMADLMPRTQPEVARQGEILLRGYTG